jgi:hypothetical protein
VGRLDRLALTNVQSASQGDGTVKVGCPVGDGPELAFASTRRRHTPKT